MPRVFVSYSRKSRDAVKLLADDIEALGHIVWFDRELVVENLGGIEF